MFNNAFQYQMQISPMQNHSYFCTNLIQSHGPQPFLSQGVCCIIYCSEHHWLLI